MLVPPACSIDLPLPWIMGIINVTPDSFSDGGRCLAPDVALEHGLTLVREGAAILDVGGESTRPGSDPVSEDEEVRRVVRFVRRLADEGVAVSVDTMRTRVAAAAVEAGAAVINDVRALQEPGALDAVRGSTCGVVLMHMRGMPRTMQSAPRYDDVVAEVAQFLGQRVDAAMQAGIAPDRIVVDPGFGFGKTMEHNFTLLRRLDALQALGRPVLAGLSRKSMLGAATGRDVDHREAASLAAAVLAVERGARIVRVHDVAGTRDAVRIWAATQGRQA